MSDVSLASAQAPSAIPSSISSSEGGKPGGLRHRDEEVEGRPRLLERAQNGDGRAALKVLTYCLGSKGFLPRNCVALRNDASIGKQARVICSTLPASGADRGCP